MITQSANSYYTSNSWWDTADCYQPCLAQQAAESVRKSQGHDGPVVVSIACPCPRCSVRC